MRYLKKLVLCGSLLALSGTALASPSYMVTENKTSASVSANIGGQESRDPVKPGETKNRPWFLVKAMCKIAGQSSSCSADIVANKNGDKSKLGTMTMNLDSGEISPKQLNNGRYTLNVVGNAHVIITENK